MNLTVLVVMVIQAQHCTEWQMVSNHGWKCLEVIIFNRISVKLSIIIDFSSTKFVSSILKVSHSPCL